MTMPTAVVSVELHKPLMRVMRRTGHQRNPWLTQGLRLQGQPITQSGSARPCFARGRRH